ncbi:MAG: cysteine desulfurase [Chlamydiales bacterium]
MKNRIYLDNNATTFLDPRVCDVLHDHLDADIANPSSVHIYGQESRALLTTARRNIAKFLSVKPHEIIFTSGGTEAINMIIRGIFGYNPSGHIITSDLEHAAVFCTAKQLEKHGCEVSFISPGIYGAVTAEMVGEALRPDTKLITLMAVNNETGVKTDIESIALMAAEAGVPFMVDAVALMGKEPFTIPQGVTAMCFSAHKFHGPKGVGMAFVRPSMKLQSHITGGGHEHQRRSGTENLPGIVAMAEAVKILSVEQDEATDRMRVLRDRFEEGLRENIPDIVINGEGPRVVNTTNIAFPGVDGESLLMNLDLEGLATSHGSACSSGALEPSRVLLNMGISRSLAASSLRFSLCRFTTAEEIERSIEVIADIVSRLNNLGVKK